MRFSQCSLDYKLELYTYIFDNGFDHFKKLTLLQGHVINGIEVIQYDVAYCQGFDVDDAFRVF